MAKKSATSNAVTKPKKPSNKRNYESDASEDPLCPTTSAIKNEAATVVLTSNNRKTKKSKTVKVIKLAKDDEEIAEVVSKPAKKKANPIKSSYGAVAVAAEKQEDRQVAEIVDLSTKSVETKDTSKTSIKSAITHHNIATPKAETLASPSIKEVLSLEMSKDIVLELAKLKDSYALMHSKFESEHKEAIQKTRTEFENYRRSTERKFEEYERAISTLTVKSQNLETELAEAHSRELNYINGSKMASSPPPEADPVTVLTKTIEELKAQLKLKEEENEFLDSQILMHEKKIGEDKVAAEQVLVVDAKVQSELIEKIAKIDLNMVEKDKEVDNLKTQLEEAKRTIASSAAIIKSEKNYTFKLDRMVRLYEHMSGIIVSNVIEQEASQADVEEEDLALFSKTLVYEIIHKGKSRSLSYTLVTPNNSNSNMYIYKPSLDQSNGDYASLPEYLKEEIIFKSGELFFEKVFEWVMGSRS